MTILCKLKFACDQKWSDLNVVAGEERVRHCLVCSTDVHRCSTMTELGEHASQGHCVAFGPEALSVVDSQPEDSATPIAYVGESVALYDHLTADLKLVSSDADDDK